MAYYGRGENRIKNPYNLSEMYDSYTDKHQDNPLYNVDRKRFYDLCSEFYKKVVDGIMYEGRDFKTLYSVGDIYIKKYRPELEDVKKRTSFIDWANTAKLGKIVYHLNEHSNGFKFTIKWKKKKNVIRYVEIYKFVPTRAFKRNLASVIKNKENDYLEKD
jgi:hypothetical protein